jgi:Cof subfamily protein (haloacid dehalogenase superfamily)
MSSIRAIILDVDGVIVGEKRDFNLPYPNRAIINRLKEIKKNGLPVFLCTAKPYRAIKKIVDDALLNNFHFVHNGAVVINPEDNNVLDKHKIKNEFVLKIIEAYSQPVNYGYVELYSTNDYYIEAGSQTNFTGVHSYILQQEPTIVKSLPEEAKKTDIVKIMIIAKNQEDKEKLTATFLPFKNNLTLSWGVHPIALPYLVGIITDKGVSKKLSVEKITKTYKIDAKEILAIGDSLSDWQFIEPCGYAGAPENANDELKKLVLLKGKEFSFIGKSVDENGILDILNYFLFKNVIKQGTETGR